MAMKTVKILDNGLILETGGRGNWRLRHPDKIGAYDFFESKAQALAKGRECTGKYGYYAMYEEGGEVVYGHRLETGREPAMSKEEALEAYKKEQIAEIERSIAKLEIRKQEIEKLQNKPKTKGS